MNHHQLHKEVLKFFKQGQIDLFFQKLVEPSPEVSGRVLQRITEVQATSLRRSVASQTTVTIPPNVDFDPFAAFATYEHPVESTDNSQESLNFSCIRRLFPDDDEEYGYESTNTQGYPDPPEEGHDFWFPIDSGIKQCPDESDMSCGSPQANCSRYFDMIEGRSNISGMDTSYRCPASNSECDIVDFTILESTQSAVVCNISDDPEEDTNDMTLYEGFDGSALKRSEFTFFISPIKAPRSSLSYCDSN